MNERNYVIMTERNLANEDLSQFLPLSKIVEKLSTESIVSISGPKVYSVVYDKTKTDEKSGTNLDLAFKCYHGVAKSVRDKLKYGNPRIVHIDQAKESLDSIIYKVIYSDGKVDHLNFKLNENPKEGQI